MKNILFKFITVIAVTLSICVISCSDETVEETDTEITVNSLPKAAIEFLNKFYSDITVSSIEKDIEEGITIYDVKLENGNEIIFNEEGIWQQVDAPSGFTIPSGIAPQEIEQYLNENYSGYGINEINRTGYGYKVQLVSELNLMFNDLGEFIGLISEE